MKLQPPADDLIAKLGGILPGVIDLGIEKAETPHALFFNVVLQVIHDIYDRFNNQGLIGAFAKCAAVAAAEHEFIGENTDRPGCPGRRIVCMKYRIDAGRIKGGVRKLERGANF
jgi:hypothetical protein